MAERTEKPKKSKMPTIVDVAARAGVTIGTVSHVLNKTAPISEETTRRVLAAIRELGYKPNSIARALRTKKSCVIGFLLPDITNDFYTPVLSTFIDHAHQDGYTVLVVSYQYSAKREEIEIDRLVDKNVDGILLFNGCDDLPVLRRIKEAGIPLVVADRRLDEIDLPTVGYDNVKTVCRVVDMLCKKGCRRIGFLSESTRLSNLYDRYAGYQKGLAQNGIALCPELVYISENLEMNNLEQGYLYIKHILKNTPRQELPDAIFATTDLLAIGAMRALEEMGFQIPQDIGVVGFDNIAFTEFIKPKLTTVEQDKNMMGSVAWEVLKNVIDGKSKQTQHVLLPQKIIIKESC